MRKINPAPELLQSKKHFEVLDGLRGIAAVAIVIFHFMEWIYTDPSQNFIGHGFLAVDFFFCLSGFVIAYAYNNRIGAMGIQEFFRSRLIRLHPLVILGSVLGLAGFFLDPFLEPPAYSASKFLLLFLASIFLIPLPLMEDRAFNNFGLNAPAWSLFWEYVANIVYAFILCRLGRRVLLVLAILAAGGILLVSYRASNLLGGWSKDNFWDGGVRVAYSFLAGMLIYRSNWIIKNNIGFIGLGLLLSAAFVMPVWPSINWLTEALVVLFYFPLLVSLGAGSSLVPSLRKVCNFSGHISYPLYMTHYAFIWIFGHYYTTYKPGTGQLAWIVTAGILLLIGFAYLVMVVYDTPVRRYLTRKRQEAATKLKSLNK